MNFYLFPGLEFGPRIIRRLLDQLPPDCLDHAIDPERFTPREVVAHLADWEPIMRERVRIAVTSPGVVIPAFDEGQMAIDNAYAATDPVEQAELFSRERRITIEYLRTLSAEAWPQQVQHPERGPQSAEDLTNMLLGHDLYHIEQLTAYLA